jgi:hypothetical protein
VKGWEKDSFTLKFTAFWQLSHKVIFIFVCICLTHREAFSNVKCRNDFGHTRPLSYRRSDWCLKAPLNYRSYLATCLVAGSCWNYFFNPEDEGDMFFRNVGCNSTDYTASHPRRWYSSYLALLILGVSRSGMANLFAAWCQMYINIYFPIRRVVSSPHCFSTAWWAHWDIWCYTFLHSPLVFCLCKVVLE